MFEQQLDFGKCYYRPAFFHMKIDFPISMENLNDIPDGAFGLYLHEYIHFIQDISTIYGLMNISTINYYIQASAHKIANEKKNPFDVPIKLDKNSNVHDFGYLNFKLRPTYIGSSIKQKSKSFSDLSIKIQPFEYDPDQYIDIVIITFKDSETQEIRAIEFGGNHVTEGMAYLCEQFYHKGIIPEAEAYPYKIVSEIVKAEYPEIVEYSDLLISICDASLMTYHPGLSFVRLVRFLKERNIHEAEISLDEIYKICLAKIKGSHVEFDILVDNVISEIKNNFSAPNFQNIRDWIDIIFGRIKIFRNNCPSFVNDIVVFGKPMENIFFIEFLRVIGSPLTLDGDDNGTISLPINFNPPPDFNLAVFWAINQVLKVFSRESVSPCELMKFCQSSRSKDPSITIDENCSKSPWLKSKDKNLCPFAQIWRQWALTDYYPNYR